MSACQTTHVVIGSDHAGFLMKDALKPFISTCNMTCVDIGTHSADPCDYPDYAHALAHAMLANPAARGILICGTGVGMSVAANRFGHLRAALCTHAEMVKRAREHNDANVLVLGARLITTDQACEFVDIFLKTPFEGGRHAQRLAKLVVS